MKSLCFLLIASFLLICSFTLPVKENAEISMACDNIPELNKKMYEFVKSKLNKKVGRGECWDLAAQGLNSIGANWDKDYVFGKEVDPVKDCIYPGDIIQFEGVKIQYQKGKTTYFEEMDHHTAVVYKVNDKGSYVVAEQNTSVHGKKVGLSNLELKNILKGKYKIFEPVK
jgi:hypothetical protein